MTKAKRKSVKPDDPSALQKLLVRRGFNYDDAALAIRKAAKKGEHVSVTAGYLGKVANGHAPSLKLGRVIVRWARTLREEITLADLGIQVEA